MILTAISWLSPAKSAACSCAALTPRQAYTQADAVFEAYADEGLLEPKSTVSGGRDVRRYRLRVVRVWKGLDANRAELLSFAHGNLCGLRLEPNQPYLIFATRAGDGDLWAHLCSGTVPSAEADAHFKQLGEGTLPGLGTLDDPAQPSPTRSRSGCGGCGAHSSSQAALLPLFVAFGLRRRRWNENGPKQFRHRMLGRPRSSRTLQSG